MGSSPIMLEHLGDWGVQYLTVIFNLALNTASIPSNWKIGRIFPDLKPGKPADEGTSYRQITLLSPAAKILERVILPELQAAAPLK